MPTRPTTPPAPTVAKANEAVELAEGTRDLCRRDADRAICHLHDVVAAHHREWLDAQEPVTDDLVARLPDLIAQLEHGFADAAAAAGSHDRKQGVLQSVVTLFSLAVDEELIARNPFRGLMRKPAGRADQPPPTDEEFRRAGSKLA